MGKNQQKHINTCMEAVRYISNHFKWLHYKTRSKWYRVYSAL